MNAPQSPAVFDVTAEIREAFELAMATFMNSPALQVVQERRLTQAQYRSVLREIYHYTKEDPQMQAYAAVYFRGRDREMVAPFFRHAISEIGHERLALADLETLGEDISGIELSQPLPATIAFTAFGFYQITFGNPVGYLGYLYFLEFLPTQHGSMFGAALQAAGIPDTALTFLRDHMTVDVGHNRAMEKYLSELVRSREDLDAVIYTMRVTAALYRNIFAEAFDRVVVPVDYGTAWAEAARTTAT